MPLLQGACLAAGLAPDSSMVFMFGSIEFMTHEKISAKPDREKTAYARAELHPAFLGAEMRPRAQRQAIYGILRVKVFGEKEQCMMN